LTIRVLSLSWSSTSRPALAEKFDRRLKGLELNFLLGRQQCRKLCLRGFACGLELGVEGAHLQHQRAGRGGVARLDRVADPLVQRALLLVQRLDRGAGLGADRRPGFLLIRGETDVLGESAVVGRAARAAGAGRMGRARGGCAEGGEENRESDGNETFHRDSFRLAISRFPAPPASCPRKNFVRNVKRAGAAASRALRGVRLAADALVPPPPAPRPGGAG